MKKFCYICLLTYSIDMFPPNRNAKEGISNQCRNCGNARNSLWRMNILVPNYAIRIMVRSQIA